MEITYGVAVEIRDLYAYFSCVWILRKWFNERQATRLSPNGPLTLMREPVRGQRATWPRSRIAYINDERGYRIGIVHRVEYADGTALRDSQGRERRWDPKDLVVDGVRFRPYPRCQALAERCPDCPYRP